MGLLLQFLVALMVILFIMFLVGGKAPFYPGGLLTICIIMFIVGTMNLAETFPFALGFGVRRTDYVLGTTVMALEISALTAVLWLLCSLLELVTGGWNIELYYFHLPYFNDGSLIEQFWVYFMVLANMHFLGCVVGSIFLRFGRVGTVIFVLTVFLVISFFSLVWTYLRWWGALFAWFSQFTAFELALGLLPCTALFLLALYLLLRRAVA
jgi:hypothetical protein